MGNLRHALLGSTTKPAPRLEQATNAVCASADPPRPVTVETIREAMAQVRALMPHGVPIGDWMGCEVYASPHPSGNRIIVVDPATGRETMRFSADHPLVRDASMGIAARRALGAS